jgi:4,5-dihydroxyphthalate decarboxylase
MTEQLHLTIACGDYDRTRAIKDGRVQIEGCRINYLPLEPEEVFFRAFRNHEFDIAELSFSSYLLETSRGKCQYVGIPAFVSRIFRHSGIYIRTDRGIREPRDLRGKRIGLPEYQLTAIVWIRGMLEEEYGVRPVDIRWFQGGQEEAGRDERTPLKLTNGVEVQSIPPGKTLTQMLADGELDALFTARAPSCFTAGAANVGRLFPNYREVEKEYYRKTGLFPIMHLVGIRQTLVEQHPWLAASVYKAFLAAKALAVREVRDVTALRVTLPWAEAEALDTMALMGSDYWHYGVAESRQDIEAICRYSYQQGLAVRHMKPEQLFAKSTLELSKI